MIRQTIFDEVGLLDPRLAILPDFDMWVRLCMNHEIHVMESELTAFRKMDNNRNMSAPRTDTVVRVAFEVFQILKHYRGLNPEFARKVFANDLAKWGIDANQRFEIWLSELALHSGSAGRSSARRLFALDTMFEASAMAENECRRLIEWTGKIDVFNIIAARQLHELQRQSDSAQQNAGGVLNRPGQGAESRRNAMCHCGSGKRFKHCHGRLT